jgi:RNA polymerase sigma-54 factor
MAISLNTRVSQTVSLTPQLQQSIKLLQLSNSELEQELAKAAEENPLLEFEPNPEIESNLSQSNERVEVIQQSWGPSQASQDDDEDWGERYERVAHKQTLLEYLDEQIHLLNINPEEQSLIAYMAGCLDDRGYLPEDLEAIHTDLASQLAEKTSLQHIEKALAKLQTLDPPGIGARGSCRMPFSAN